MSELPMDLVLVRHGLSEANVVQNAEKNGMEHPAAEEVYKRPDYMQRLAHEGIDQAGVAGQWLRDNFIAPEDFDERYVSVFYRTLETAQHLGGAACSWLPEIRLIERDWGVFGAIPRSEREEMFPHTQRLRDEASLFVRLDGGESITDTNYRVRDVINTLSREMPNKRVLAVTHGEVMWAARYVIERMLPQEWHDLDNDRAMRIGNCCILWYSRRNPDGSGEVSSSLSDGWRLMVNPVEPEESLYGGEWQKLPGKRRFNAEQLGGLILDAPPILPKYEGLSLVEASS